MISTYYPKSKQFADAVSGELSLISRLGKEELAIVLEGNGGTKFIGILEFKKTGAASYPAYSKFGLETLVVSLGSDFYIHYEIEDISKEQRSDSVHPLRITAEGLSLEFNFVESSINFDSEDFDLSTGGIIEPEKAWYVNKWAIWTDKKHYERCPEKPIFSSASYV